jgi:DNA-binding transcriptional LysR family regulator
MIALRHLKYFVALAEELHFGRAAQRLHLAQPGLSQQIKALESELGVLLLARSRRRVELTPAGRTLLEEGRRALTQVERAANLTRRVAAGEIGPLTIGSTESAAWGLLPELIDEYRKRYGSVHLTVREMTSPMQVAALRSGEIDVGLLRPTVDTAGLAVTVLREEKVVLLLPETHRLARRRTIPLKILAGEPMIVHSSSRPGWSDFIIGLCRSAGFEPQISQEASNSTTAASFVAAGLGFTMVPESLKGLVRPRIVWRPIANPAPKTQIIMVYCPENAPPTLAGLLAVARDLYPPRRPKHNPAVL